MKSGRVVAAIALISLGALAWVVYRSVEGAKQADRQKINEARRLIDARDFASSDVILTSVIKNRPDWTEASYLLGLCQRSLGRETEALTTWSSIPDLVPFSIEARLEQSRLEERLGALRKSEIHARQVLGSRSPLRTDARRDLSRMLRAQGRFAEALQLQESGKADTPELFNWLRERYRFVSEPLATEGLERYFEVLAKRPLSDDRVLLGQANLSTLTGKLTEADSLLNLVEKEHANELPVVLARFGWAIAADRLDLVLSALPRLGPLDLTDAERVGLALWLASKQSSPAREFEVLNQLQERLPQRARILDRLSVLATQFGDRPAIEIRRAEQAEADRTRLAFEEWIKQPAASSRFDLTKLIRGEKLGPEAELIGLSPVTGPGGQVPRTLADLYAPATAGLDPKRSRPPAIASVNTPLFQDKAEALGLRFTQQNGSGEGNKRRLTPPITGSGGLALFDFDSDGRLDVYAVQGGQFPPAANSSADGDRLFHQKPDGSFEDVTKSANLSGNRGYGHGVTVGDFDNDGHSDLFVTRWRKYALYRNKGDGSFEDVTAQAGLSGDRDWPTSAAFADLDNDGDLDLYVVHYLRWDETDRRPCIDPKDPTIYNCSPRDFPALPDHLFRNDGGKFVDISESAGIIDKDGRGWGVVANDFDADGKVDLYVTNDMSANYLFHNLGGLKFEEIGLNAGAAANGSGSFQAGMGVDSADLDGDGLPDLAVTNFFNESTTFFRNLGQGFFGDQTAAVGLAGPSRYLLGFGVSFFDANNDGRLDLITANGHVHDGRPQFPWMMPLQLLVGTGSGRLLDVSRQAGPSFAVNRLGRGLAVGDVDNDGRTDVVVLSQNGPLAYLHNETAAAGKSITLLLEGSNSNRDAIGAVVRASVDGKTLTRFRVGGGSFQSASDPRIQVGLGETKRLDWVEIKWPSGRADRFSDLRPGAGYRLREGNSSPVPLSAWPFTPAPPTR